MKLLKTISNILGVIFIIMHLTNASAADYFVNDNSTTNDIFCTAIGNNANSGTSAGTPKESLTAILLAYGPSGSGILGAGDVFYVDAGTYYQTESNLGLNLDNISIIGAGSAFTIFDNDAASTDANRWATLSGDNIVLQGLYLTGYNYGFGDAIVLQIDGANNFTINDVMVNENLPGGGSSAIFITGSSTGAFIGGGASCNPPNPSVAGGGVNIEGPGNIISFNNFNASSNTKDLQGGAGLYINGNNTTIVTLTNCLFEGNETSAAEGGGAILILNGAQLNITGSCFNNNSASKTSSTNYGGAIMLGEGSAISITDCSFNGNSASPSGNGGAIAINSTTGSTGGTPSIIISATSFSNNSAIDGADVYTRGSNGGTLTATECTWSNTSDDGHVDNGSISLSNSGDPNGTGIINPLPRIDAILAPNTICPSSPSPCFSVLPVEFIDFTANCKNNKTLFEWSTATELNNDYFILEQSRDLISFEKIAKIQGNGTTQNTTQYKLPIETEDNGIYYRLKQVDIDGRINELKTIAFEQNCSEDIVSNVFFNTSGNIEFTYNSTQRNTLTVDLINTTGAQIHSEPIDTYQHESHYQFGHFKSLPSGVYFIRFTKKDGAVQHAKIYHP